MLLRKLVLAVALATASWAAQAQIADSAAEVDHSASGAQMALDLLIARPLGLAATALGTVVFVAQLPLDLLGWQSPAAPAHRLVVQPAQFTFTRPLGDFE